jgi:hypothetical protein
MNVNDVVESYVRDVAGCLPRERRADVAFELRVLLEEELAARAQVAGHAPDTAMAMALLKDFGRPADAAQRYYARPALIEAADTHHFLIWALGGLVVLAVHVLTGHRDVDFDATALQWLGILLLCFALAGWWRRRRPGTFAWKPTHGPDWMPRSLSALALVGILVFPVFMYAAPVTFAGLWLPAAVPVDGLTLSAVFAGSWQRALTLALLIAMALQHGIAWVLGGQPTWWRRADVAVNLALGVMLVAHAAPRGLDSAPSSSVFVSAAANTVAAPIFMGVGGMMVLFGLYYAYREWMHIQPAPTATGAGVS